MEMFMAKVGCWSMGRFGEPSVGIFIAKVGPNKERWVGSCYDAHCPALLMEVTGNDLNGISFLY